MLAVEIRPLAVGVDIAIGNRDGCGGTVPEDRSLRVHALEVVAEQGPGQPVGAAQVVVGTGGGIVGNRVQPVTRIGILAE